MNKRQQKEYDKINLFLSQFEAKIKDGESYVNSENNIIIVNKYGIERVILANNIKRLTTDNEFLSFDGIMNDRQKKELEIIKNIAKSKGGTLISSAYQNSITKLEFKDKDNNKFLMSSNSLKNGDWSAYEANRVKDPEYHLKELRVIAESNGGKLLSTEYVGSKSKLKFIDSENRIFFMRSDAVKGGSWSPFEVNKGYSREHYLSELKIIAEKRGGKLISTKYLNSRTKLEFVDKNDNIFWATSHTIKKGMWSPFEGKGISEEIARQCFEFIFDKKFTNTRKILIREEKPSLELDGFNEELNMAFEYQGEQHYQAKWVMARKEDKEDIFKNIQQNDKEKLELCRKMKIPLILIPFFPNFKNDSEYLEYVFNILKQHENYEQFSKYIKNLNLTVFEIDYKKIPNANDKLIELEGIAKSKGGKLISQRYTNNLTKLQFEDKNGHRFYKTYSGILRGNWSPFEYTRKKGEVYYLNEVKKIAESKGGKLISETCDSRDSILEFEDKEGKRFFKNYSSIKQGTWSPFEGKKIFNKEYHLNVAKEIAESRGGKLISTEYINCKNILEFEDSQKRRFFKSYRSITNGVWTPFENKMKKSEVYYLEQMQKIAEMKGGKLISLECNNTESILEFEDKEKRRFFRKYSSIIKGAWSPFENKIVSDKNYHLNIIRKIAETKGGKLISTEYVNSKEKLEFENKNGYRFWKSSNEIKNGRWSNKKP